jgi:hypothetical protein
MKRITPLLASLLAALLLACCQGSGGVHEAPPSHPTRERSPDPAALEPAVEDAPEAPVPGADRRDFAEPPQGVDEGRPELEQPPRSELAPPPAAPRKWRAPSEEYDARADDFGAAPLTQPEPVLRGEAKAESSRDAIAASPPAASGSGAARGRALEPRPRAPRPESRPGLATHWGEQRYSPTREVSFVRARSSPDTLARLQYDDRAGAYAALPGGDWSRSEIDLLGGKVVARVVDGSGAVLPALRQGERVQIIGDTGERYVLELENRTASRFEIVASVDGLDVLDGKDADPSKRGYLLGAYQTLTIDGFRDGRDTVAAFRFGNVGRSYAASKGKARNVGVIGVALFRERSARRFDDETVLRDTADPFPGRYATPPSWR